MAELTILEAKLGEVTGLAMAAQAATKKVITLAKEEHPEVISSLERMNQEAAETTSLHRSRRNFRGQENGDS